MRPAHALVFFATVAAAKPGDLSRDDRDRAVDLLDPMSTGRTCLTRGAACITAGDAATRPVASPPVAATTKVGAALPAFRRVGGGAALADGGVKDDPAPWTIEIDAYLARAAVKGPTLFVFYDLADPAAVEKQEVAAIHHADVLPGRALAARIRLSPDEGFNAGRTYRVRVVQILAGKEVLLAEGDFSLR